MPNFVNPFLPPPEPEVSAFIQKVQPTSEAVHRQVMNTSKNIGKAIVGTAMLPVDIVAAGLEHGAYLTANVLAVPSAILNRVAAFSNHTRDRIHKTLAA